MGSDAQHGNRHVALYFITDKNHAQGIYKNKYQTFLPVLNSVFYWFSAKQKMFCIST